MEQGPFDIGALELAAALRARQVSTVEVVRGHIRRIEAWNPSINAVVAERFEAAMDDARRADDRLAKNGAFGPTPPLLGVPFTCKEFVAARGMPQTGGMVARRHVRAARDAPVIARLKEAGAILLGVTNAPEGGLSTETYNRVYGRTANPWDVRRTAGGSSGGEGASVGAGLAAFGIGSDLGGSIRIPAAFCGCVGHKPSAGLVPIEGHYPMPHGDAQGYLSVGPLARRVADVGPLLSILAGRTMPSADEAGLQAPGSSDLRHLTVYPVEHNHRTTPTKAVRDAIRRATEVLRARGARIGEYPARRFRRSVEMWSATVQADAGPPYSEVLGAGERVRLGRETAKWLIGRSNHTFAALSVVALEGVTRRMNGRMAKAVEATHRLRRDLVASLGSDAVLLFPPYGRSAPKHTGTLRHPFDFAYAGIFNVLRLPATQVPTGFDRNGMPVGVQVVAGPGMDSLTLQVAQAIEQECGGWVRPERLGKGPRK